MAAMTLVRDQAARRASHPRSGGGRWPAAAVPAQRPGIGPSAGAIALGAVGNQPVLGGTNLLPGSGSSAPSTPSSSSPVGPTRP